MVFVGKDVVWPPARVCYHIYIYIHHNKQPANLSIVGRNDLIDFELVVWDNITSGFRPSLSTAKRQALVHTAQSSNVDPIFLVFAKQILSWCVAASRCEKKRWDIETCKANIPSCILCFPMFWATKRGKCTQTMKVGPLIAILASANETGANNKIQLL